MTGAVILWVALGFMLLSIVLVECFNRVEWMRALNGPVVMTKHQHLTDVLFLTGLVLAVIYLAMEVLS